MARFEAMGRWNGKAWRVNIWKRRAVRRDQRRYRREFRETVVPDIQQVIDVIAASDPLRTIYVEGGPHNEIWNFHPHKYDQWNSPGTFESTYTEN